MNPLEELMSWLVRLKENNPKCEVSYNKHYDLWTFDFRASPNLSFHTTSPDLDAGASKMLHFLESWDKAHHDSGDRDISILMIGGGGGGGSGKKRA